MVDSLTIAVAGVASVIGPVAVGAVVALVLPAVVVAAVAVSLACVSPGSHLDTANVLGSGYFHREAGKPTATIAANQAPREKPSRPRTPRCEIFVASFPVRPLDETVPWRARAPKGNEFGPTVKLVSLGGAQRAEKATRRER